MPSSANGENDGEISACKDALATAFARFPQEPTATCTVEESHHRARVVTLLRVNPLLAASKFIDRLGRSMRPLWHLVLTHAMLPEVQAVHQLCPAALLCHGNEDDNVSPFHVACTNLRVDSEESQSISSLLYLMEQNPKILYQREKAPRKRTPLQICATIPLVQTFHKSDRKAVIVNPSAVSARWFRVIKQMLDLHTKMEGTKLTAMAPETKNTRDNPLLTGPETKKLFLHAMFDATLDRQSMAYIMRHPLLQKATVDSMDVRTYRPFSWNHAHALFFLLPRLQMMSVIVPISCDTFCQLVDTIGKQGQRLTELSLALPQGGGNCGKGPPEIANSLRRMVSNHTSLRHLDLLQRRRHVTASEGRLVDYVLRALTCHETGSERSQVPSMAFRYFTIHNVDSLLNFFTSSWAPKKLQMGSLRVLERDEEDGNWSPTDTSKSSLADRPLENLVVSLRSGTPGCVADNLLQHVLRIPSLTNLEFHIEMARSPRIRPGLGGALQPSSRLRVLKVTNFKGGIPALFCALSNSALEELYLHRAVSSRPLIPGKSVICGGGTMQQLLVVHIDAVRENPGWWAELLGLLTSMVPHLSELVLGQSERCKERLDIVTLLAKGRIKKLEVTGKLRVDTESICHVLKEDTHLKQYVTGSISTSAVKCMIHVLEYQNSTLEDVCVGARTPCSAQKKSGICKVEYLVALNRHGRGTAQLLTTSACESVNLLCAVSDASELEDDQSMRMHTWYRNRRHAVAYGLLRCNPGLWCHAQKSD